MNLFSKKISDWNEDHFFGGGRVQKSPRGEGYLELFVGCGGSATLGC